MGLHTKISTLYRLEYRSRELKTTLFAGLAVVLVWEVISRTFVVFLANVAPEQALHIRAQQRRRIRHARRAHDVLRPLFPSYLFVHLSPQTQRWRPIMSSFGVRMLGALANNSLSSPMTSSRNSGRTRSTARSYDRRSYMRFSRGSMWLMAASAVSSGRSST
jgi:dihydrodipicolinate synthase/N-acetylneuraminate lyase